MDGLILCGAYLILIFSILISINIENIKVFIYGLLLSGVLLIWAITANIFNNPIDIVTYHPIEEIKNNLYYVNRKNILIPLTGDKRFADPKKCIICITTAENWSCGLYITSKNEIKLVKIEEIEKPIDK